MRYRIADEPETYARAYGLLTLLAGNTRSRMCTSRADMKLIRINPGESTSRHRHLIAESIFHVLEGEVTCLEESGVSTIISSGTTFVIEPGEYHQLYNPTDRFAVVLEVESPPHDSSDKYLWDDSPASFPTRPLGRFWGKEEHVRIKVCGVKSVDAAWMCFEAGVDAIGIHCVGGSKVIERLRDWSSWLPLLPDELSIFLLTDVQDPVVLERLVKWCRCDTIQLQGPLSPDIVCQLSGYLRGAGLRFVKSVGLADMPLAEAIRYVSDLGDSIDGLVVDTTFKGGTGRTHNWAVTQQIAQHVRVPIVLAGGLRAGNVRDAVEAVKPFGVDVETGVEVHLGSGIGTRVTVKSFREIIRFSQALRASV